MPVVNERTADDIPRLSTPSAKSTRSLLTHPVDVDDSRRSPNEPESAKDTLTRSDGHVKAVSGELERSDTFLKYEDDQARRSKSARADATNTDGTWHAVQHFC